MFTLFLNNSEIIIYTIKRLTCVSNLKLVSAIFYQISIFSPSDSPSKTVKNGFYFT